VLSKKYNCVVQLLLKVAIHGFENYYSEDASAVSFL
jgi:hypothetical protein